MREKFLKGNSNFINIPTPPTCYESVKSNKIERSIQRKSRAERKLEREQKLRNSSQNSRKNLHSEVSGSEANLDKIVNQNFESEYSNFENKLENFELCNDEKVYDVINREALFTFDEYSNENITKRITSKNINQTFEKNDSQANSNESKDLNKKRNEKRTDP